MFIHAMRLSNKHLHAPSASTCKRPGRIAKLIASPPHLFDGPYTRPSRWLTRFLIPFGGLFASLNACAETCAPTYENGVTYDGELGDGLREYGHSSLASLTETIRRRAEASEQAANPQLNIAFTYDGSFRTSSGPFNELGYLFYTEYGAPVSPYVYPHGTYITYPGCVKAYRDRWHDKPPPPQACFGAQPNPGFGNPIFPLTGSKRQYENLGGAMLAGRPIELAYDTARKVPSNDARLRYDVNGASAVGELWGTSLHKRLVFQGMPEAIQASRGLNIWVSFYRLPNGSLVPDADVKDKLQAVNGGWRYTDDALQAQESYDGQGNLQSVRFASGSTLTYVYSDANTPAIVAPSVGLIVGVVDERGRSVQFRYELPSNVNNPRIKQVIDPSGAEIDVSYDSANNLKSLAWPDGRTRQYLYEASMLSWALTGVIDENGSRLATYQYDAQGRALGTQRAGGVDSYMANYGVPPGQYIVETSDPVANVIWRDHYWQLPQGTTLTTPTGAVTSLEAGLVLGSPYLSLESQPAGSGCPPSTRSMEYDGNGNPTRRIDFNGHTTAYPSYDLGRNLELQRVEASGTPQARAISTQWHPIWRLQTLMAEPGKLTTWVYNGRTDPLSGNAIANCANGAPSLPDGSAIAVLCKKVEQATTDANGGQGFGAAVTGVPRVRQWTYNADGQMLSARGPRTDVADTTTYEYRQADDGGAMPLQYRRGDLYRTTNAAGHVTTMTKYDGNGRLLEMVDPNGLTTTMTYSPRGWMTSSRVAGSGADETTVYEYDAVGQLKKVTQPDGTYLQYTYDAAHRLTDVSDSLGNLVHYLLDAMGNRFVEQVNDPSGALTEKIVRNYVSVTSIPH